MKTES